MNPAPIYLEITLPGADDTEADDWGKVTVFCLLNQAGEKPGQYWHRVGVTFGDRWTNYEINWYNAQDILGDTAGVGRALYDRLAALPAISRADVKRAGMRLS